MGQSGSQRDRKRRPRLFADDSRLWESTLALSIAILSIAILSIAILSIALCSLASLVMRLLPHRSGDRIDLDFQSQAANSASTAHDFDPKGPAES